MKTLYFISGTMGVGKTTICKILKEQLNKSVLLEGDDCWNYENDKNNEQAKKEVIITIINKLNEYINQNQYENIIFCWVMHLQSIIDSIIEKLNLSKCILINISLVFDEKELINRLSNDIYKGIRDKEIIERSIKYLPLYEQLNTIKIDTTHITPKEVADEIIKMKKKMF